ncbi:DUF2752 domain-containing protein [Kitasatospora nipponensis]|uniref:DUF2752 domain-containing protein n=1 Tax=Kitasatospora nipponensis TaxID=258049 RepID=A0ABN1VWN7_9ACTN
MTAPSTPAGAPGALRRLASPLSALAAVALPTAFVATVDPNSPGHYPTCPFLQLTGWWCPGCGGLRCVHALTRGELGVAVHDNLLAVALFGVLGVLWVRWARAALTRQAPPGFSPGLRHVLALIALMVAFTVLRNLPAGGWLAPPLV